MMKALLAVRLRAMLAGFMAQSRQKKKKSRGVMLLFAFLYVYVAVVIAGMMCMMFGQLAPVYHAAGLDWLYFSMAGLMALMFAVFGSVFSTQSQLYEAKDNDLLLSMPIRPGAILFSRMVPLLLLTVVFAGLVMIPASVMYAISAALSPLGIVLQVLSLLAVTFLAQAAACLLGWGLHLLLNKMNKSFASLLYMVVFLGLYFWIYSQAGNIMNSMAANGASIASALEAWAWPICAMGRGCTGEILYFLIFAVICGVLFGVVYYLLSRTFLKSATSRRSARRRKLNMAAQKAGTPAGAIVFKEWRHFLGSPVYLTNTGIGILLTAVLAVAAVIFRRKVMELLELYAAMGLALDGYLPLIICALLGFMASMMFISAPSVSLEGKNLWILRSMPVSSKRILQAKLRFHILLTTPVTTVSAAVVAVALGCGAPETVLCALVSGLFTVLNGMLGMVCGLRWAKLDWLSEAYPCKQGAAAGITMFASMGVPLLLAGLYFLLARFQLTETVFMVLCALILAAASFGLYRVVATWGVRRWESLQ